MTIRSYRRGAAVACLSLLAALVPALGISQTEGKSDGGSERAQLGVEVQIGELPRDQEMISHFKANRSKFDELVRLYQTDTRRVWRKEKGNLQPFETDEYRRLLKEVGVDGLGSDDFVWLANPYNKDAMSKAKELNPFSAFAHHGIFFNANRNKHRKLSPRLRAMVWKAYFYVPVPPRVDGGRLWWPISPVDGEPTRSAPVFSSLDEFPAHWLNTKSGKPPWECVYRQVESQWFLKMCAYAV